MPQTPESQEPTGDESSPVEHDEESRLFYERLEQTGQLIDVEAGADITALPPRVTHVRYPNGAVERIGFSASPYGSW